MPIFPSVEWFDAVRATFNNDESYRGGGGGTCDAIVGIKAGQQIYLLVLDGFECTEAREIDESELESTDFYLDMSLGDGREMLDNIKEHGAATLNYTLNTLDLERAEGLLSSTSDDQYRQDLFFRYNQTFQYFFDASARVETVLQPSPASTGDS